MMQQYHIHILNYNYNPEPLLASLVRQLQGIKEHVWISVWDDGSDIPYRRQLSSLKTQYNLPFITWNLGHVNLGRAVMRQKILDFPEPGWLLNIDSDMVPDADFIATMVTHLKDPSVVYAGRHYYQTTAPAAEKCLHWNYGKEREKWEPDQNPYLGFTSGIFALHSSMVDKLAFNVELRAYGHEDTHFGLLLEREKIEVVILPLTALHAGLKPFDIFISNQASAIVNLKTVVEIYPHYASKLVYWSRIVQKVPGVRSWLGSARFRRFCLRRLKKNPRQLLFLDLWKLSRYIGQAGVQATSGNLD